MKKVLLFSLLALLFSCKGGQSTTGKNVPEEAFSAWMHSHEDDTEGVKVYRPANYDFPPSRGRQGWEIKKDGSFIHTRIGPTDIPTPVEGKWVMKAKNELEVSFPGTEYSSFPVKIISVTKDMMKIDASANN